MQRLADKQPLIIVVADAHWADSSTLELVDHLIPRSRRFPCFS
jgi:predicted ATPase